MALQAAVSSIAFPLITGNFSITGVGFQPKINIFWMNGQAADGNSVNALAGFGVATSSSDRRSVCAEFDNGVTAETCSSGHDNSKCIYILNSAASVTEAADFVSNDSDGITLNATTISVNQPILNVLHLGGADITNVATGQFTAPGTLSDQAITGLGFAPDFVFIFQARGTNTAPPAQGAGSVPRLSLGFGTSVNYEETASTMDYFSGANVAKFKQVKTKITTSFGTGSANPTAAQEASLKSLDSGGFTITWGVAGTAGRYYHYFAIKGGQHFIGSFNQATSTGNQIVTTPFQGQGIFAMSGNQASGTGVQANTRFSIGVGTSASKRGCTWFGHKDTGTPTVNNSDLDRTKLLKMITEGASPTVNAAMDLVSFDTTPSFTVNNTTADATSREVYYWIFGNNPSPAVAYKTLLGAGQI